MRFFLLLLLLLSPFIALENAVGFPALSFTQQEGDWYDNWGIDRNYYDGTNGYLPGIASETLKENKELAYSIGQQFLINYESKTHRAEAILSYVQEWTEYGYDSDYVTRGGIAQEEWAWNADEMANALNESTGIKATGDCEDLAFLCGTIYMGAGFDAAAVDAPGHVALLIWLPEFSNANNYWDIPNDGREAGWIWVEATSDSNPLGWTPPDFSDGNWNAYPLSSLAEIVEEQQPFSMELIILAAFVLVALAATIGYGRLRLRRGNATSISN
jgi:hypothetical protein